MGSLSLWGGQEKTLEIVLGPWSPGSGWGGQGSLAWSAQPGHPAPPAPQPHTFQAEMPGPDGPLEPHTMTPLRARLRSCAWRGQDGLEEEGALCSEGRWAFPNIAEVTLHQSLNPAGEKQPLPRTCLGTPALGTQPPCCQEAQPLHGKAMWGGAEAPALGMRELTCHPGPS